MLAMRMGAANSVKHYIIWYLGYKCDYRCPYCPFAGPGITDGAVKQRPDAAKWLDVWHNLYRRYGELDIRIDGGEPFLEPSFPELVAALSGCHRLTIKTNLSLSEDGLAAFIAACDRERVKVEPFFHPAFSELGAFIGKAKMLRSAGFRVNVRYVAYPAQLEQMNGVRKRCLSEGLRFTPAVYTGKYGNDEYPSSYTYEEMRALGIADATVSRGLRQKGDGMSAQKYPLCAAGYCRVLVKPDGEAIRCRFGYDAAALGNIFEGGLKFLGEEGGCAAEVRKASFKEQGDIISPLFPRNHPPYRIHWNWEITFNCNYRCSYCPVCKVKDEPAFTLGQLEGIWDRLFRLYGVSHVRLSGGEPSVYSDFYDLVGLLSQKNVVDITTNLSFDVKSFARRFRGESISISASFHPEYNEIEDFVERLKVLRDNGLCVTFTFVTYPAFLSEMDRFRKAVEDNDIYFKCIPFNGEYEGKRYPIEYQSRELEQMREAAERSNVPDLNKLWYDWRIKDGQEQSRGDVLCRMGQMYAKIFVNGDVTRCCAEGSQRLGNIGDRYFRLLEYPQPCDARQCPCFKAMAVGRDEEKWQPQWTTIEHRMDKRSTVVLR